MDDLKASGGGRRTAEDRRERIITAARTLFARQGFHRTGMAHIARESDVLVGQIYRDFASKEDLIAAIAERDSIDLLHDTDLGSVESAAVHLEAWIRHFITRTLNSESRAMMSNIMSEATINPRYAVILQDAYARLRERLLCATAIWAPEPDSETERGQLVDFILAIAAGLHHRQIVGLPIDEGLKSRMTEIVSAEIATFRERRSPSGSGSD